MTTPLGLPKNGTSPALRGGALTLLAAALFGHGLGAFSTAALLYAGAAFTALWMRQLVELDAKLKRCDLPRLLAMAGFGAIVDAVALTAI